MIAFDGLFGLVLLGLWIFCIIDVITTDASVCRNLPKLLWLVLVLILPDIGSIAWLIAGRPWAGSGNGLPYKGNTGRAVRQAPRATNPDDDEEFQALLRRRAQEQRRKAQGDPPPAE